MRQVGLFLNFCHGFRLHVLAIFLLLLLMYVGIASPIFPVSPQYPFILVAFTLLWAAAYIGNRYFDYAEDKISQAAELRDPTTLAFLTIAAYLIAFLLLLIANLPIVPYLLLVLLTLGYSVTIFGWRVKSIFILKNVYAAGAWWLTLAVALSHYIYPHLNLTAALELTLPVFFLGFVIEMFWDIRDIKGDLAVGNLTIPNQWGLTFTKIIMTALIGAAWWWQDFQFFTPFFFNLIYLFLATVLVRTGFPNQYFHTILYGQALFIILYIVIAPL